MLGKVGQSTIGHDLEDRRIGATGIHGFRTESAHRTGARGGLEGTLRSSNRPPEHSCGPERRKAGGSRGSEDSGAPRSGSSKRKFRFITSECEAVSPMELLIRRER
jgi:hypothetical protein